MSHFRAQFLFLGMFRNIEKLMERALVYLSILLVCMRTANAILHDYSDALSKSILFFEGQRSGKLPSTQRLSWRHDSALQDGLEKGVDLTGGYYDAGDNVKFNFPMAFSTTMLAWGVIEYGSSMGPDLVHALDTVRWSTDYLLKATATEGVVYAQVGDPNADHNCWERPEDMDTPRTVYQVSKVNPGSEVAAEIAAALAAASLAFKISGDRDYSKLLLRRATKVFEFADEYRGSYSDSIRSGVCPFYCGYNGYQDELLWAAAWIYRASKSSNHLNYVIQNIINTFKPQIELSISEFGWDAKHAGINVLLSKYVVKNQSLEAITPFLTYADKFVCAVLPQSPTKTTEFTPGGLLLKSEMCNMQHIALSFLLLTYARYLKNSNHLIRCNNIIITQNQLIRFSKTQLDYILGDNPMNMSYMVGYGSKYPERIHHRGSSMPSIDAHPQQIGCKPGTPYFLSGTPNPNLLVGAVVGGSDSFVDDRADAAKSEPTTYVNAPLVGLLAYFKARSSH